MLIWSLFSAKEILEIILPKLKNLFTSSLQSQVGSERVHFIASVEYDCDLS